MKPSAVTDAGEPVVFFSPKEIDSSWKNFRFFVIAKCYYGRMSILEVKQIISPRFQLSSEFLI